jgi:hypothetical protein
MIKSRCILGIAIRKTSGTTNHAIFFTVMGKKLGLVQGRRNPFLKIMRVTLNVPSSYTFLFSTLRLVLNARLPLSRS